ncbi:PIN domain-containing protein [Sphaerimonospora thailandensis]|uniref:PIN domain-containing protein n=1 Tax=Sphaerimonospora thailandensis TaxID=795644 RepID=UPI001951E3E3|nr:PIN domain-containing protein [Sphaerimonospora thailandensis]
MDTNVASFVYLQKPNSGWENFAALMQGHVLCMSFASVAEMLVMAHRNSWGPARRRDLINHVRLYTVLKFDIEVCKTWAPMYAKLRGQLKGEGVNDLWTAACAMAQNPPLPIITDDLTDFGTIGKHFELTLVHPTL